VPGAFCAFDSSSLSLPIVVMVELPKLLLV